MNESEYPTPWQQKILWGTMTALAIVAIGAIAVGLIWLISRVLGFLQPILIPFAVAGVLAYLFDPAVSRIERWGTTRQRAVMAVFAVMVIFIIGIALWIVPAISGQTARLVRRIPVYTERVKDLTLDFARDIQTKTGYKVFPELSIPPAEKINGPNPGLKEVPPGPPAEAARQAAQADEERAESAAAEIHDSEVKAAVSELQLDWHQIVSGEWVQKAVPVVLRNVTTFITSSVGGFMGFFGFLLSMVIVPVYLWYFLIESPNISANWGDYLPLTKSAFKDEVVSTLGEINGYLIAFFRGQLIVSLINGAATATGLMIVGLDFGLLIGLGLCVLGLIPYLGIILCWIPAVIIASVQVGGTWIPNEHWWVFPLVVTGVFTVVQQIDGLFITPKIVGESVGLHPMTVIFSVFAWSLLMGGLLGAILAVPMTATLKVLLRRYVWEKRIRAADQLMTEETASLQKASPAAAEAELVPGK